MPKPIIRSRRKPGLFLSAARWRHEGGLLGRHFPRLQAWLDYQLNGRRREQNIERYVQRMHAKPQLPWFQSVELETLNRCNGECAFCPVNRQQPQRPYARMGQALYERIISQLAAMNFRGGLALYSNNEPLLDPRLPELAAYARKSLPLTELKLFTNGTLLTLELFRKLMPSFDRITVNNYNATPTLHPGVQEIYDYCRTPEGRRFLAGKRLYIQLRNPGMVLSSRAGQSPNRDIPATVTTAKCRYPFNQLVIRPDGKISLCCNDGLGKMTLGDLSSQTIAEAWRGKARAAVCNAMAEKGRSGIPLCAACDFVK